MLTPALSIIEARVSAEKSPIDRWVMLAIELPSYGTYWSIDDAKQHLEKKISGNFYEAFDFIEEKTVLIPFKFDGYIVGQDESIRSIMIMLHVKSEKEARVLLRMPDWDVNDINEALDLMHKRALKLIQDVRNQVRRPLECKYIKGPLR